MNVALDTNVLVRLLTGDDPEQCARALRLIKNQTAQGLEVLITLGVVLETEWVLRSRYRLERSKIRQAFAALLEAQDLVIESPATMEEALKLFGDDPASDFADCMHVASARQRGAYLATFDQGAGRLPGALLIA